MDQEINLKPCPFCGREAKVVDSYDCLMGLYFYFVECSECTATFLSGTVEKSDAVKQWNERVHINE